MVFFLAEQNLLSSKVWYKTFKILRCPSLKPIYQWYFKGLSWCCCLWFIIIISKVIYCFWTIYLNIFKSVYIYIHFQFINQFCYSVNWQKYTKIHTYFFFYYTEISIMCMKTNTKSLSYFSLVSKFQEPTFS